MKIIHCKIIGDTDIHGCGKCYNESKHTIYESRKLCRIKNSTEEEIEDEYTDVCR